LRLLIVNADDFGYSGGINRGIVDAHESGIVTSASLMVNRPAASEAAEYAREHPGLGVGLHAELRRWRVRRRPWSLVWTRDRLRRVVARELAEQLERFGALVGRDPTHLDSHYHRHRQAPLRPIFESAARELGVPLRHFDPRVEFRGDFYGHDGRGGPDHEAITVEALIRLIESVGDGVTELGCHPGYAADVDDWYRIERELEVQALCDDRVRAAVERTGARLGSFAELNARSGARSAR
jgi:predicted glycoside hydrolase/deacetylase ChbG (UPF0249 family)